MTDVTIEREDDGREGRYIATLADREEAGELVYEWLDPSRLVALHTVVPESLGGLGVGTALVTALTNDARAGGYRIVPRCKFVAAQARRHPEWAALFTEG